MIYLKRSYLIANEACAGWLALYDEVIELRGGDTSLPLEIDTSSPLSVVALCLPLGGDDYGSAWYWLKTEGFVSHVEFAETNFRGLDLRRINLSWANLTGADLRKADISGANLRKADISGANLTGANLRGANLTGANLSRTALGWANLTGANLTGANLTGSNLIWARRAPEDPPIEGWNRVPDTGRLDKE